MFIRRKFIFLLLFLVSYAIADVTATTNIKKNSIQLHPCALLGIGLELYSLELTYTRSLGNDFALVLRPSYENIAQLFYSYESHGTKESYEFEAGIRRYFTIAPNAKIRFGIYPQVGLMGGYVDLYVGDYLDSTGELIVLADSEGYTAKVFAAGGLYFQYSRFFLSADIGACWGFIVPKGLDAFSVEPNFALGITF